MGVHVTAHAILRYRERVADLPDAEIITALRSPTITQAVELGCCAVKLCGGQHAILKNGCVITILPKGVQAITRERA